MDVPAIHYKAMSHEVVRDHGSAIIGKIERQRHTGFVIARNAQGVIVGHYSAREGLTRGASGRIIAPGDVLAALLFRA